MQALTDRREGREEGFTLIELMVVVLIMGILMAIAIPTFLSTTRGANNTAAQSNLTNALIDAKAYYDSNNGSFGSGTSSAPSVYANLSSNEPSFVWSYGSTPVTNSAGGVAGNGIAVQNTANTITLESQAKGTNECYFIYDVESASSSTAAAGTYYAKVAGSAPGHCTAPAVPTGAPASPWFVSKNAGWS